MNRNLTFLVASIAAVSTLTACNSSNKQLTKLTLTGSSTVAPLASEMAKRFEAKHPGVRIDVQTGGSSRGIADAESGVADIGMVSRSLKPNETQKLQAFAIARDGISPIVNAKNPVNKLTNQQIVAIYQGKINNWQQVGGKDAPITVINKAEGRSTLELFLSYFKLENSQIKASVVIGDNQQGIKTVAGNPNAIAYVSIGAAESELKEGTPIKLLPINGVEANTKTVQNSTFPLSRPLMLVTKPAPSGLAKEFLDFAQSQQVYDLVESQNFVPLTPKVAQTRN
ncbi:phosphate ABC transporter substrate-binding protein [Merismopedia glauca]|uniref:ABC transporter substrate-binding protein n=1 Tax=Merismopedia glauca CCAP 1448/3 TaxID=1296344 RepID=A0A2T1C6V3_9CYAN|nr:phosphate ABC transporter substrate-binding protein [Merismopedia glauca]PSB03873.1 ABC transporter substrate-binding protein [Merismopedia glauca CCAP 1448/3]